MENQRKTILRLGLESTAAGLFAGLIVVIYHFCLKYAEKLYFLINGFVRSHIYFIIIWAALLVGIGFLIHLLLTYEPDITGSGIPQTEAEIEGEMNMVWWRVIVTKIAACTLAIIGGLSFGREGPSVQLGGVAGKAVYQVGSGPKSDKEYLMIAGAAAGLSAAFHAPIGGMMFGVEEMYKKLDLKILVSVMCGSIAGDFMNCIFFGMKPSMAMNITKTLPLTHYQLIILLGILAGLMGALYTKMAIWSQKLYQKIPYLKPTFRGFIPLLVGCILGVFLPQVMGSGHVLIEYLNEGNFVLGTLIIFFIAKLLFTMICFGSGVPGGNLVPMLILGSLFGAIFGKIFTGIGISDAYIMNFALFAMAAFFGGIVRAPLTGIVLLMEISGTFELMLPIGLASVIAYAVSTLVVEKPMYETLLDNLLASRRA